MPLPLLSHPYSFIKTFLFLSLFFLKYLSSDVEGYPYTACEPFSCGKFSNISYPFWINDQPSYCGHPKFKLDCQQDKVTIDMLSQKFLVIDMNQKSQILKIARLDLLGANPCPKEYTNVNLDFGFFNYTSNDDNYTLLYHCGPFPYSLFPVNSSHHIPFECLIYGNDLSDALLVLSSEVVMFNVLGCKNSIVVPVLKVAMNEYALFGKNVLEKGFEVEWSGVDEDKCYGCESSGGRCGHNAPMNAFMCLCPNQQPYSNGFCSLPEAPRTSPTLTETLSPLPHAQSMCSSPDFD